MSKPQISLRRMRAEIIDINEKLQDKCGLSYRLEISPYSERDKDAAVYDETDSPDYDIILCLYHEEKCISSVTGRYNPSSHSMEVLSKTDGKYEGKKYNLYLRAIFIYLMYFVRQPLIKKIYSYATNPISTYAMYKHFYATNDDLQEYVEMHNLTPETFTIDDAKGFHTYYSKKYEQTPESAEILLDEMLEDCEEMHDKECSVEDLGWKTREEAIENIIKTMSFKAIALELHLEKKGTQELLLNKLRMLNTQIICGESQKTQGGNKKTRNKKSRPTFRKSVCEANRAKSRSKKCKRNKSRKNI